MANPNRETLSRDQARKSFCIKFRHPRRFTADGKPGLAVRRGLSTDDEAVARHLVDQMNQILEDDSLWTPTAREAAVKRFHPRIVEAFYDGLGVTVIDPLQARNRALRLPGLDEGYKRMLLLGPNGAGKTTLLRQILGTNPETERFPATSANRTTTAKLEVILAQGKFQAVATFLQRDEVQQYVEECVMEAALSHLGDGSTDEVARRLLEHRDQRFRLSYILGTLPTKTSKFVKNFETPEASADRTRRKETVAEEADPLSEEEREAMRKTLRGYIERIQGLTDEWRMRTKEAHGAVESEENKQRFEEQLPNEADFAPLIDNICDEIARRFSQISGGQTEYDKRKWPTLWQFSTGDRDEFMKVINLFTGNHERHFGRLLTPLVEGIRVAGPFRPHWRDANAIPRLVLIDGEGLGHRVEAIASVPTSVSRRFKDVDVILLVDSARQPMQAAPSVAVKTIAAAGYESKLMICFTHLDLVEGDNLPNDQAKMNHVLYALTNLLDKVGQDIDRVTEDALERVLEGRVFFAAHLNKKEIPEEDAVTRTHLNNMLDAIEAIEAPDPTDVHLFYDEFKLPLGIRVALRSFHQTWRAILGLETQPNIPKEHWGRIKALARYIGYLGKDEYFHLKPAADLVTRLIQQVSRYLDRPLRWEPQGADEQAKLAAISRVKNLVHTGLLDLARDLLIVQHSADWQAAYGLSGTGSTVKRAHAIRAFFEAAAPIPDNLDGPDGQDFSHLIKDLVGDAVKDVGGRVVQALEDEEKMASSL